MKDYKVVGVIGRFPSKEVIRIMAKQNNVEVE